MYNIEKGGYKIQIPKYYVNLDELEYKLKHFSYRVRKKECLDIPDKMYIQRHVDLSAEQNKAYQELKVLAMAKIQDEKVSFNNKLTELLKLQQVTNGFVKTNDDKIVEFKTNPKLNELMNILEETEDKLYNMGQLRTQYRND